MSYKRSEFAKVCERRAEQNTSTPPAFNFTISEDFFLLFAQ